jgi:hypothetical protein|tara:strand:+ start:2060 stop:2416 length:357 start_codon:yes stop_codon:yes gene_type:complete
MELSSPRFKSIAVTAGFSFWFFVISTALGIFSLEFFLVFIISLFTITQIFAKKISKGLDIFAVVNTKIFLSILFIFVISIYGVLFKLLKIDLLRLKKQKNSYWLEMDDDSNNKIWKQY